MSANDSAPRVAFRHVGWLLVGVFGLAACLTLMFLGMRAVMDIGGGCADGGPYVSAQPCPDGVGLLMALAFPLGFLFAGIIGWAGGAIGSRYGAIALLAWPALFLSLGWNFLEYGIFAPPPEAGGIVWGWAIPGVLFIAMGAIPLLVGVWGLRQATAFEPRRFGLKERQRDGGRSTVERRPAGILPQATPIASRSGTSAVSAFAAPARVAAVDVAEPAEAASEDALVDQLERLSKLHESGALTEEEFAAAKRAVLLAGEDRP